MRYRVLPRQENSPHAAAESALVFLVLDGNTILEEFLDPDAALDMCSELNRQEPE